MDLNFTSRCTLQESQDPTLAVILKDCEIEAEVQINCEAEYEGCYLTDLQIESIEFNPPDSEGAMKAQVLMHQELMETIRRALEDRVRDNWREYESEAEERYRDMEDAAADALYERWKEEH